MTQALYRKWRPQTWDAVVGQEPVVTTLRNAVAAGRVAHAYLFAGPRGTGKTTSARLLAKAVNCLAGEASRRPCDECEHCLAVNQGRFLDLIEIDAASHTSVDDVRDLRDKINFAPNQGRYKVYIVDEVHMLSTAAFNALLKTLEEPPPHAIFILATTESHKIPATVTSRCQRHEFRRITVDEIVRHLQEIVQAESLTAEDEALALIARQATGAMRDAISLLDQLASTGGAITHRLAQDVLGTAANQAVLDIVDAIIAGLVTEGMGQLHRALNAGADPRQLARQVVEHLRNLMLLRMGSGAQLDASADVRQRMAQQAQALPTPQLLRLINAFNQAAAGTRTNWQPGLPLELALVESLEPPAGEPEPPRTPREPAAQTAPPPLKKTPPPPSQPEPEGTDSAPADSDLTYIRKKWRAIRDAVKKINSSTDGLLNSCAVLEVRGNEIILGFASETVKNIMEGEAHQAAARQALESVLGRAMTLRCVIASNVDEIPAEVESDGMVATAMRLGGKIVHTQTVSQKKN
jgi:DNA polymerase-3 subunit gamma/tau